MAEYGTQDNRQYGPGARSASYGPQRDAAFANVFGGPPPPRSQTMTSQTIDYLAERSPSLTTRSPQGLSQQGGQPPHRPTQYAYDRAGPNGISGGPGQPQANGYPASRVPPNGVPPVFNDRRGYAPPPQRVDPRGAAPMPGYQTKPGPNRMPPPALNNDAYRSRSMVRPGETPSYRPIPPGYQPGTANAYRQQPYNAVPGGSAMTAQGRQIPQRMGEDRAMTMGNYSSDRDHTQLTSGRIVPRRRESDNEPFMERSATFTSASVSNLPQHMAVKTRRPSEGNIPVRAISGNSGNSFDSTNSPAFHLRS